MFVGKSVVLTLACVASVLSLPITRIRREVPQEHSHSFILASVRASLDTNNPAGIEDPVFGLLGNAAAAAGQGTITDTDCLQQATADAAFTNAKAAGNVTAMVDALLYRALERNTGAVGLQSNSCTSITAVNPEIAAIQQHQDPASANAAATNKAIVLTLAQQIASIGGNPQDALQSGTFKPGDIGDPTGAGFTCDVADDVKGCIFSQNLLVDDATAEEIDAAVSGVAVASAASSTAAAAASTADAASATVAADAATTTTASTDDDSDCAATATVTSIATVTATAGATDAASTTAAAAASASTSSSSTTASSGQNLQTFTGSLGGLPPAVSTGGRGFAVAGEDASTESFLNLSAALQRSCSVQHNTCADDVNNGTLSGAVSQCDDQETQCNDAASSASASS